MTDCWDVMLFCTGLAWGLGLVMGKLFEAWSWRATAADFQKKVSGGAEYDVRMVR